MKNKSALIGKLYSAPAPLWISKEILCVCESACQWQCENLDSITFNKLRIYMQCLQYRCQICESACNSIDPQHHPPRAPPAAKLGSPTLQTLMRLSLTATIIRCQDFKHHINVFENNTVEKYVWIQIMQIVFVRLNSANPCVMCLSIFLPWFVFLFLFRMFVLWVCNKQ